MTTPEIFCRTARRRHRSAIRRGDPGDRWLLARMNRELLDRWADRNHGADRILILGDDADEIVPYLKNQGVHCVRADICAKWATVHCDEDHLPLADQSFDAVFSCGTLDSVNDLPGALILIRRVLKPGGLLLGAFLGAGSGSYLRTLLLAERTTDRRVARAHPLVDVRAAGDLLARAGFVDPVADTETISVRYRSIASALRDRRANALGNALKDRQPFCGPELANVRQCLSQSELEEAAFLEEFCPVYLTAQAPY